MHNFNSKILVGGPHPEGAHVAVVQPGIVQAVAAQPEVGRRANPGKSLSKKGMKSLLLA